MPLSESQMMERIHAVESLTGVMTNQISDLKDGCRDLWDSIKETRSEMKAVRESISTIRVDVAKILGAFGIIQTIIVAVIVWKTTH